MAVRWQSDRGGPDRMRALRALVKRGEPPAAVEPAAPDPKREFLERGAEMVRAQMRPGDEPFAVIAAVRTLDGRTIYCRYWPEGWWLS